MYFDNVSMYFHYNNSDGLKYKILINVFFSFKSCIKPLPIFLFNHCDINDFNQNIYEPTLQFKYIIIISDDSAFIFS
jgi:hypothetical protein